MPADIELERVFERVLAAWKPKEALKRKPYRLSYVRCEHGLRRWGPPKCMPCFSRYRRDLRMNCRRKK